MPLVAPHDIIARAFREHWALGAFNTSNLEVTQAIVWALRDARAPGIIQTSEGALTYAGLTTLRDIIRDVASAVSVPLVLHLDHGKSFETAVQCIQAGFGSVMIDGSLLPLVENIALTKRVVELAHAQGVWVEGEVGILQGKEGLREGSFTLTEEGLTDPREAADFVEQTGVDALAVSVGTAHGAFRGKEEIRFERLAAMHAAVPIPLVLHGASGIPDEALRRAVGLGVAKVNIDTELRESFHDAYTAHREDSDVHSIDPRTLLAPAREAVQKKVAEKVVLLGSMGKAAAEG